MLVQRTVHVKMRQLSRIRQIGGNSIVASGFSLTHVYDGSCQMKSVLNLDAFLGTTAIREVITDLYCLMSLNELSSSHTTIMCRCCVRPEPLTIPSLRHQKGNRTNWSRIFSISLQNV
ncbi:hypothetical protein NPIL_44471 [Nephila pilipes]|uniref:Uncharacterized protein n=1 Tax=Nephila pilipes TaxID=299642 RepID=A0A8X6MG84_NEPPI|nr:hypothetical protein NPIL_44471 [Nephila pilipes]